MYKCLFLAVHSFEARPHLPQQKPWFVFEAGVTYLEMSEPVLYSTFIVNSIIDFFCCCSCTKSFFPLVVENGSYCNFFTTHYQRYQVKNNQFNIHMLYMYLPNHSSWAGCVTRSILSSLTGLNSEFSFSKTGCHSFIKEFSLPFYYTFPKSVSTIWNAASLVQDLNLYWHVYFLWQ